MLQAVGQTHGLNTEIAFGQFEKSLLSFISLNPNFRATPRNVELLGTYLSMRGYPINSLNSMQQAYSDIQSQPDGFPD
jgi:hypothetical protein